ncbi:MAG: FixH family protein [Vicinamibacterales bacterium]
MRRPLPRITRSIVAAIVVVSVAATLFAARGRLADLPFLDGPGADAAQAEAQPVYVCPMHPDVRSHEPGRCPQCGMELVLEAPGADDTGHAEAHGAHAEAASPATPGVTAPPPPDEPGSEPRAAITLDTRRQQLIGVRTVEASRGPVSEAVRATGLVRADETRQVDVNLKVPGWIERLYVDYTGRAVRKGEPLFDLYSPELVAAQQEYLLAIRSRQAVSGSSIPDALRLGDDVVAAARERLRLWDLSDEQIDAIASSGQATRTITFRAPVSGRVLDKAAMLGMRVTPGQTLFRIVDLSRVWVEADVYEAELGVLATGTRADVRVNAFPSETFPARLTFVAPTLDEVTRTVRARFELPNPGGRLRPGMYATVDIAAPPSEALTIPTDALLDTGRRQIVFVSEGDGYYRPQDVRIGRRLEGHVEILSGLEPGTRVAAAALFFLDSESQLRAGLENYAAAPAEAAAGASDRLSVDLASEPDPPKAGRTTFIATIRDAQGTPVTGAEVSIVLFMPAMPSMNMPAMRSDGVLTATAPGVYRGSADVLMSGRWDVTVTVTRGGQRLGMHQRTLVAR